MEIHKYKNNIKKYEQVIPKNKKTKIGIEEYFCRIVTMLIYCLAQVESLYFKHLLF